MTQDVAPQDREVLPMLAQQPLLAARFFPPPLPRVFVPRPRLMDLMLQGLHVPLTLISAPPGFGKSSLVRQWIQEGLNLTCSWLSLESSDQEWTSFYRYLVAAWQRIFPQAGETALVEGKNSSSVSRETLLDLLLNDLLDKQEMLGTGHALLVLDDYHRIESAEIHETILYLVEHLPSRCHLVLLTRADPPFPLSRWRSRGLMLELRADDLRFTPAEATQYLNQPLRLGVTESQVRILMERTEGWVAGLQMAAISLQRSKETGNNIEGFVREFDGSNRFVLDYLVDEVVNLQEDEVQQFLLYTAFLDRFCAPLCDTLLDRSTPYSHRMLARLEKANLFLIPLDDRRYWFRYHHLFADLLRLRLQQTHPEQVPELFRRAAGWFFQNGLFHDAIRCALQSKDWNFCADLFEQSILKGGLEFLHSGIRSLIDPFPADMVECRPMLCLARAEVVLESSRLDGIEPLLRFAEEGIRLSEPFTGKEDILGLVYLIQAEAARQLGDHDWINEVGRQITKWAPKDVVTKMEVLIQLGLFAYYEGNLIQAERSFQKALDLSLVSKNTDYTLSFLNYLAKINNQRGELKRSEAYFQQAFDLLAQYPDQYLIWLGAMQRDYSNLLRDLNRLDEALAQITAAIPLLEKYHPASDLGYGFCFWAKVLLAFDDFKGAEEILNKADDLRRKYNLYPDLELQLVITHAEYSVKEGQIEQARQAMENCMKATYGQYMYNRERISIVLGRILVRTGRPAEALDLLSGSLENAKANGRGRNGLSIGLLTALAYRALGDRQKAFQFLEDALEFALAQGHRRALIDEGQRLQDLLEEYRVQFPQSPFSGYLTEILMIFASMPKRINAPAVHTPDLDESLTPREVEILHLVCQGLSNQEIARQLVLSVGTVKFHIHHIFGKLGVRDRPQAIAKAVLLGL